MDTHEAGGCRDGLPRQQGHVPGRGLEGPCWGVQTCQPSGAAAAQVPWAPAPMHSQEHAVFQDPGEGAAPEEREG